MRVASFQLAVFSFFALGGVASNKRFVRHGEKYDKAHETDDLQKGDTKQVAASRVDFAPDFVGNPSDLVHQRDLMSECNAENEGCCSTPSLNNGTGYCYDQNYWKCASNNVCVRCGNYGQACCDTVDGPICNSENQFCRQSDNTCQYCGNDGQPCCPDQDMSIAPGNGSCSNINYRTCVDDGNGGGVCERCGDVDQVCCHGDTCRSAYASCDTTSNTCVSCGGADEDCCPFVPGEAKGRCDDELSWQRCVLDDPFGDINGPGTCKSCGKEGETCCAGAGNRKCHSGALFCNATSDQCESCGDNNEVCCPNRNANYSSAPGFGTCRDADSRTCVDDGNGDGVCVSCGGVGQPCCQSNICDHAYATCDTTSNTCVSCGGNNEDCCPFVPGEAKGRCDDEFNRQRCVLEETADIHGPGTCTNCGYEGEVCCSGEGNRQCHSAFLSCSDTSDLCESCGDNEEACCPDPESNFSTAPGHGKCRDLKYRTCVDDGSGGGVCKACGQDDGPCCHGDTCHSFFSICLNSSCVACGNSGSPCCEGNKCNDEGYRSCNINHMSGTPTCEDCGDDGELPCLGAGIRHCRSEFSMVQNGTCTSCGNHDEPCCPTDSGNVCRNSKERICMADMLGPAICKNCGGNGQPCCNLEGVQTCDDKWSMCMANDEKCKACGKDGEQCCPGPDQCSGWNSGCEKSSGTCMRLHLHPSENPSESPSKTPSWAPSSAPTLSAAPSDVPSASPSDSPSRMPTVRPTLSLVPSHAPTVSSAPTLLHAMECPPTSDPGQEVPPSILTIGQSDENVLCRIILVNANGDRVPVARSYDASEWHQYPGAFSGLDVSCDISNCTIKLEEPEQGSQYLLVATTGYNLSHADTAARFFEAASFGMPKSEIIAMADAISSSPDTAIPTWIEDQIDVNKTPMSSLREFFRKHTNGIFEGSSYSGEVTQPCDISTTYRKYAFSEKHYMKFVNISTTASGKSRIEVDGELVTLVEGAVSMSDGTTFGDGMFQVCWRPEHFVGGDLRFRLPSGSCQTAYFNGTYGNPPVDIDGSGYANTVNLDGNEAQPIDENLYQGQVQMLSIVGDVNDGKCSGFHRGPGLVPTVFAKYDGEWFVHSPRFKILDNTFDLPMTDGGGSIVSNTTGDATQYQARCANVARTFLNEESCFLSSDPLACPVDESNSNSLVCGSPGEVSNDLSLGGTQSYGAFDMITNWGRTSGRFRSFKKIVWNAVVLSAPDQLRQRMAWALSQILVANTAVGRDWTEAFVNYYDIFVKHAFGNYRDILKEVSYSPMMAYFLSYYESKSTAYHMAHHDMHRHPDENYAREVMQLFTVGLNLLNEDGTTVEGPNNLVYTNDDIMEYSRVWTGFRVQNDRGNIEGSWWNRVDPMQIRADWRDRFPKMGLLGQYIGDGYPLCADLPIRHFLKAGATYRLLGNTSYPELQSEQDRKEWVDDSSYKKLAADPDGNLFLTLCNGTIRNCNYSAIVTLADDIDCVGAECHVNTVRTIEVDDGIFYEYVRPACVHLAFYENPTKIKMRNGGSRTYMCADPRTEEAGSICCDPQNDRAYRYEAYLAERVVLSTVQNRCDATDPSMEMCNSVDLRGCSGYSCWGDPYFWTNENCQLKIKIDSDRKIAIVHNVPTESAPVTSHVDEDTMTFFRVHWNEKLVVDKLLRECDEPNMPCKTTADGYCMCDVSVSEDQAYFETAPPSREDVLKLTIGAFPPRIQDTTRVEITGSDVWVYGGEPYTKDTVFEVVDHTGKTQFRKNMHSTVFLMGPTPTLEFRTPVHLMSLAEENERDAMYETDAALDHYFYHPNTPVFLALRFAQRFGVSNPSPRYVKAIGRAFKEGSYTSANKTYGTGHYGDLAATVAAVLLDSDARNTLLEADGFHGSFREPLLKLIQLMRSLEFQPDSTADMPLFRNLEDIIGQNAFEYPDVFSFFQPGFSPPGIFSAASLVAPVAKVINTPEIFNTINGFQSLIKYGLMDCYGGFGYRLNSPESIKCWERVAGDYHGSTGFLSSTPDGNQSADAVVDDLNLLMTSGRLSTANRAIVKRAYEEVMNATTQHHLATIRAQQLILTTPEFHTNGRVTPDAATNRTTPSYPSASTKPYKAVVLLMLNGGCDSFNMIVPKTCNGSSLVEQYEQERGDLALTSNERNENVINMDGQPCQEFSLHPKLTTIKDLYVDGDLSFFFNTGVMNAASDKTNYNDVTQTRLFAHDAMQEEAYRADPFNVKRLSGVLGRLADALSSRGYQPDAISIDSPSIALTGLTGNLISPTIVNRNGVVNFHPRPYWREDDIKTEAIELNGGHDLAISNIFGETWSARFARAIWETDKLDSFLSNVPELEEDPPNETLATRFSMLLKLMLTKDDRGSDRDVFYASIGGFDHHDNMKDGLEERFDELNISLDWFHRNLKRYNLWDNVTIVAMSDFGRTMTPNSGEGSDHGWGGNYWVTGGSVKGGQGLCKYPSDITASSPLNVGRGRLIPECAWESMWNPVAKWMFDGNLTDAERDGILVNARKTGAILYNMTDLFD